MKDVCVPLDMERQSTDYKHLMKTKMKSYCNVSRIFCCPGSLFVTHYRHTNSISSTMTNYDEDFSNEKVLSPLSANGMLPGLENSRGSMQRVWSSGSEIADTTTSE